MWSNRSQTQRPPSAISYLWLWCRRNETWTPAERRQTRHVSSAETAPFQARLLGERGVVCAPPHTLRTELGRCSTTLTTEGIIINPPPMVQRPGSSQREPRRGLMRINTARWGSNVAKISRPLGAGLKVTGSKALDPPRPPGSAGGVPEVGMLEVISCYPERPDPSREGETFAPKPHLL